VQAAKLVLGIHTAQGIPGRELDTQGTAQGILCRELGTQGTAPEEKAIRQDRGRLVRAQIRRRFGKQRLVQSTLPMQYRPA
jgi:hypothetical protein